MDPLDRMVRGVARSIGAGPDPRRRARQRRRVAELRVGPRRTARGLWLVGLATACVLVLAWLARGPQVRSIAERHGPVASAGAWLAAGEEALAVEFAEHGRVVLAPGSAMTVIEVAMERPELRLERGPIDVIGEGVARGWRVGAGPYTLVVTGTRTRIEWRPDSATLAVEVVAGRVHVHGGDLPEVGTTLVAGQRLVTSPALVVAPAAIEAAPTKVVAPRREPGWRALAEAGEHAAAVAAAERSGLAALLERLDAADLERLAHSARMARAADAAQAALQALLRRFPGDPRASTATFLLGRVALDLLNDRVAAARWFAAYVQREPAGPLAAEARGRLVQLRHESGDLAGARAAAEDYLQHHPDGSRANLARTILGRP